MNPSTAPPMTVLDARWLHKGGTGSFTRSLLAGLADRQPEGWTIWGPHDCADLLWPGARLVRTGIDPASAFGQRSVGQVPRGDLVFHPHQTRPFHRQLAASCILDLIQLDHPNPILRAGLASRLALTVRSATTLFTIADVVRDQLVDRYAIDADAVTVLRLPVDEAAAARVRALRASTPPRRQLVAIGRFARHKNQARLAEAFGRTQFAAHGGELVLVGGTAEELGWDADDVPFGVRVPGFVPDAELEVLLASSLALVQPSLAEGLGLPVLEALLGEVPVVSSPVPAVVEMGPSGIPVFDPTSLEAMTAAIDATVDLIDAGRYWSTVDRAGWLATRPTPRTLIDQVLARLDADRRPSHAH